MSTGPDPVPEGFLSFTVAALDRATADRPAAGGPLTVTPISWAL